MRVNHWRTAQINKSNQRISPITIQLFTVQARVKSSTVNKFGGPFSRCRNGKIKKAALADGLGGITKNFYFVLVAFFVFTMAFLRLM